MVGRRLQQDGPGPFGSPGRQDAEHLDPQFHVAPCRHGEKLGLNVGARQMHKALAGCLLDRAGGGCHARQPLDQRHVAQPGHRPHGGHPHRLVPVRHTMDHGRGRRAVAALGQHAQEQDLARRIELVELLDQRGGDLRPR